MDLELIIAMIGAITGIVGMILGVLGIFHNRFLAVNDYMLGIEDPAFIAARRAVYQSEQSMSLESIEASTVINFFQHWGMLARKRYLPLWVFDTGAGAGVIRLFEGTKSCIDEKRSKNNDPSYALDFEWLYKKLKKRKPFWLRSIGQ